MPPFSKNHPQLLVITQQLSFAGTDKNIAEHIESIESLYIDAPVNVSALAGVLAGETELAPIHFYFVRDSANFSNPLGRLVATLAYFAAFICVAVLAIQNVVFVITYFL